MSKPKISASPSFSLSWQLLRHPICRHPRLRLLLLQAVPPNWWLLLPQARLLLHLRLLQAVSPLLLQARSPLVRLALVSSCACACCKRYRQACGRCFCELEAPCGVSYIVFPAFGAGGESDRIFSVPTPSPFISVTPSSSAGCVDVNSPFGLRTPSRGHRGPHRTVNGTS